MDFLKRNHKWIGIVGCVVVLIGCFLPFVSVSLFGVTQSVNYMTGDGKLVLVAIIVSAILILLGKEKFSLISSIIAAVIVLYDVINGASQFGSLGLGGISFGIGLWVIIIGLVLTIASVFLKEKK